LDVVGKQNIKELLKAVPEEELLKNFY